MGYGLDTTNMVRHSVELELFVDRAKRRFATAQMSTNFEQIIKKFLPTETAGENLQPNTLHLEHLSGGDDSRKLANFLEHILDRCARQEQHDLLQAVLRRILQQSRRRCVLDPQTGEPQEPMCYFCMADLTGPPIELPAGQQQQQEQEQAATQVEPDATADSFNFCLQPDPEPIARPLPEPPTRSSPNYRHHKRAQQQQPKQRSSQPNPASHADHSYGKKRKKTPRSQQPQQENEQPVSMVKKIKLLRQSSSPARSFYQIDRDDNDEDTDNDNDNENTIIHHHHQPLAVTYQPQPPGSTRPHPFEHVPYLESAANIPPPLFVRPEVVMTRPEVAAAAAAWGPGLGLEPSFRGPVAVATPFATQPAPLSSRRATAEPITPPLTPAPPERPSDANGNSRRFAASAPTNSKNTPIPYNLIAESDAQPQQQQQQQQQYSKLKTKQIQRSTKQNSKLHRKTSDGRTSRCLIVESPRLSREDK